MEKKTFVIAAESWAVYYGQQFQDQGNDPDTAEEVLAHVTLSNTNIEMLEADDEWFEARDGAWPEKLADVETI